MTNPDPGVRKFPSLSVFFPAYNDALSLPALIAEAFCVLERCVETYEVIVVNDGSQDNTGEVLARLQTRHGQKLRIVTHSANRGYGGALRSGFEAAALDYVFYTDGDGQYDVGELPRLLEAARPRVGLVNGYKLKRSDPWHRVLIGRVYNTMARGLFRIRIRDIDCDFRVIRRELLADLGVSSTSGTVCVELVRKLELTGCGVVEVGVHHYPRLHGRSQFFRVRSLLTTFTQLLGLYFRLVLEPAVTTLASRDLASMRRIRRVFSQAE
jgi:glycosyltransferase involved in cell wall biosynthesis